MNALVQSYDAEIEEVLAYHGGDVHAAIEALLKDRDFLIREVELSRLAVTHGQPVGLFKRAA
ncbi:hypothetical protein F9K96_07285 [Brucella anthropi]|uniref:CUE domain-containing protein n=1 Tax=Brucella anthropi TaxID=529 RepID=UPI00124F1669|nr:MULTISPECIES: CUE domain-containing protein [Brucella/Ochrobactrum group]KAB2792916.1 hypothetical protein F9K96_07285 [Brucella anthropi]NIH74376.1 hypothetical protein [Ochrobactrum sp. P20RRXII]